MSCQKTFIIKVVPPYYAYYKLDEAAPTNVLVDSVGAKNLTIVLGNGGSTAGKIGTALDLGTGVNHQWNSTTGTQWLFAGSFTIRFWIKPALTAGNIFIITPNLNWYVEWFGGSNVIEFLVDTDDGNAWVDTPAIPLGTWSHIVAWYEDGVGVGIRINNGTTVTAADASPTNYDASAALGITESHFMSAGFALDEIAFWNQKLTDAEITADWNGGAGVTY